MSERIQKALTRTTDTRYCLLQSGAIEKAGTFFKELFPGCGALIVCDGNTWEAAGKAVLSSLKEAGVRMAEPKIFPSEGFYAEWRHIDALRQLLRGNDLIAVAVGSGVLNDLSKLSSHLEGKRYMCVGTAASMDGFTAYGASITKDGNKQTFSCPAPLGFVMDPVIAADAPQGLSASGYGDLLAKIPAGADWILADALKEEAIDTFAWDILQGGLKDALSDPDGILSGDITATGLLSEGLLLSGFAMQAMHSSRPASGTEHQMAHYWDMENLSYESGIHVSHGYKVAIGTLLSTAILEFLLQSDIQSVDEQAAADQWPSWPMTVAFIHELLDGKPGHLSRCLEETKAKYASRDEVKEQIRKLKSIWPLLKEKIRGQIIPFDQVRDMLQKAGAPYEPEMIGVSREHLRETFLAMPYMRSRYTAIDAVHRLGLMRGLEDHLFGRHGIWSIQK